MPLKSMTGFARSSDAQDGLAWHWEIRTLNGRGLDIRLRLPPGSESLEQKIREACAKVLARGNCTVNLTVKNEQRASQIRLNENALRQAVAAIEKARQLVNAAPPSMDGLLAIKGIIEIVDVEDSDQTPPARIAALFESFLTALGQLAAAREAEGRRLETIIRLKLDEIGALVTGAEASPARSPAAIQKKLSDQMARLAAAPVDFDQTRLYQEAVMLAAKADIEEEIARLKAHIMAAYDLLSSPEAAGRQLEFLTQEFNREANTLCSKSNGLEITRAGLMLKSAIDQLREQVQNIE